MSWPVRSSPYRLLALSSWGESWLSSVGGIGVVGIVSWLHASVFSLGGRRNSALDQLSTAAWRVRRAHARRAIFASSASRRDKRLSNCCSNSPHERHSVGGIKYLSPPAYGKSSLPPSRQSTSLTPYDARRHLACAVFASKWHSLIVMRIGALFASPRRRLIIRGNDGDKNNK